MSYCVKCGKKLEDNVGFCPDCGQAVLGSVIKESLSVSTNNLIAHDKPSNVVKWISFFFPIIGIILYVLWQGTTPKKARSALEGAMKGLLTCVILVIVFILISIILTFVMVIFQSKSASVMNSFV